LTNIEKKYTNRFGQNDLMKTPFPIMVFLIGVTLIHKQVLNLISQKMMRLFVTYPQYFFCPYYSSCIVSAKSEILED